MHVFVHREKQLLPTSPASRERWGQNNISGRGVAEGILRPVRQGILSTYKQRRVTRAFIILYQQGLQNAKLNDENSSSWLLKRYAQE